MDSNIHLRKDLVIKIVFIGMAILLFLYQLGFFFYPWEAPLTLLSDSDCYMRLLRVTKLEITHAWYDSFIDWSNSPYGEELHWTRLFDIILWLGALVGEPHLGFLRALHWWGVIISPIFAILSFFSMLWAITPYIKNLFSADYFVQNNPKNFFSFAFWKLYFFMLFMGMVAFMDYSSLSRPDHHSLLFFLFVVSFGFLLRMIEQQEQKYCVLTGFMGALSLWVSIESLAMIAFINISLLLLWIFEPYIQGKLHNIVEKACSCSMWLFVGSVLAILIERPLANFTVVEYDKVSFVHLLLILLLYFFWVLLSIKPIVAAKLKITAALLLSGVALLSIYAFYPDFFKGPFASVTPIVKLWLKSVNEVQPIMQDLSRYSLAESVRHVGMAVFVIPYISYLFFIKRKLPFYWLITGVGMLVFLPLSMYQVRWSPYCELIMLFPMMFILDKVLSFSIFNFNKSMVDQLIKIALVALIAFLPLYLPKMLYSAHMPQPDKSDINSLDFLRQLRQTQDAQTILTYIDFGPEIMYFTANYVVATPYHRNSDGILFLHNVMTAETDAEAYEMLLQRKIDMIALYPKSHEKNFYLNTKKIDTFYKRFLSGAYPAWLEPVEVPENLQGSFYLFKVKREE